MDAKMKIGGVFEAACYGADGTLKWAENCHNLVTNEGLDHALDVVLHGTTAISAWYVAISETDTTAAATMTYAVPAYTESTAYTNTPDERPAYTEAASSSQSITNSANKASFSINASKTIYGASLVGGGTAATTKGDTAGGGKLFAYGKFSAGRAVVSGDTLQVTYTVSASSS